MSEDRKMVVVEGEILEENAQALPKLVREFLNQETPGYAIQTRKGPGGKELSYVSHGYVTKRLNQLFGFLWDTQVEIVKETGDEVIVKVTLTVKVPNKNDQIVKTQFGSARKQPNVDLGDIYKAAASDGLKKCASLLGIAIDLYWDEDEKIKEYVDAHSEAKKENEVKKEKTGSSEAQKQFFRILKVAKENNVPEKEWREKLKSIAGTDRISQVPAEKLESVVQTLIEEIKRPKVDYTSADEPSDEELRQRCMALKSELGISDDGYKLIAKSMLGIRDTDNMSRNELEALEAFLQETKVSRSK